MVQLVKNLPELQDIAYNAVGPRLISESGRSLREGKGNPPQYSCLGNPWTEEPGSYSPWGHKSQTPLSD